MSHPVQYLNPVLRIRIGFFAYLDPAFHFDAAPDLNTGNQTDAETKTVCLHDVIPEMYSFSMRPAKYFYDKPLPINTLIRNLS